MEIKEERKERLTLIFDGDGVIIDKAAGKIYPRVPEVLKWCKEQGFRIALASFNVKSEGVLKSEGVGEFFDCLNCKYNPRGKHVNVLEVLTALGCKEEDVIVFDDTHKKILEVRRHTRAFAFHLRKKGIKLGDVKFALTLYKKSQTSGEI